MSPLSSTLLPSAKQCVLPKKLFLGKNTGNTGKWRNYAKNRLSKHRQNTGIAGKNTGTPIKTPAKKIADLIGNKALTFFSFKMEYRRGR